MLPIFVVPIEKNFYQIDCFRFLFNTVFILKIIQNKLRKFNKKNKTPLHYAIEKNSKEIGELLISKGADINAKDIIYLNIIIILLINII